MAKRACWTLASACILLSVCPAPVRATEYYGRLIGDLSELAHNVMGTLYVADADTLILTKFNYDGTGPDGHFYIGLSGEASSEPDLNGRLIATPGGSLEPLGRFENSTVVLALPDGVDHADILWFAIWCVDYSVNFGSIQFPESSTITLPSPLTLADGLEGLAHEVSSGHVIIQDAQTILINALHYDGEGPDAFFLVGRGDIASDGATKLSPDNTGLDVLEAYDGQNVRLLLPGDLTIFDIDWLAVYCIQYSADFGHILFPDQPNVPPSLSALIPQALNHCEQLSENLQISWELGPDADIILELTGRIGDNEYMAFGLSGSETETKMLGADVTVVSRGVDPVTVGDYFLSDYGQCTGSEGVCTDDAQNGRDDLSVVSVSIFDGITMARFKRSLNTGDAVTDIVLSPDVMTYIVWAIGPLNAGGVVSYHSKWTTGNVAVEFGRAGTSTCPSLVAMLPTTLEPWQPHTIAGVETFNAQLGPSGGTQGYAALTGSQSWGLSWYINEVLIPELTVKRHTNYTFIIEGGQNPNPGAHYHPLYITDDPHGGYELLSPEDRQSVNVYAGIDENGLPLNNAVGRLCEWEPRSFRPEEGYGSFQELFSTLELNCETEGEAGVLHWVPDDNTPDLVYYQCYSFKNFGWKIHVVDSAVPFCAPRYLILILITVWWLSLQ